MTACPTADDLLALLDGSLSAPSSEALRSHLDRCLECAAAVAALVQTQGQPAMTDDVAWPAPGELFAKRYRVVRQIGAGASGVVFEADDTQLERRVALKLLRAAAGPRDLAVARLSRESRAMAALRHANVVTVYDMGVGDQHLWVAMELIDGQSLRQWCKAPRSAAAIVGVFAQAAAGLQAAHNAGITHRDFKPDNVLVDRDGTAFVGDFGLASFAPTVGGTLERSGDEDRLQDVTLTRTDTVVGTPAYLSPEGWRGERVDASADVFAFCVSLFEALHGRRPFCATSIQKLRQQVERREGLSIGTHVPRRLRPLLRAGLAPEPVARPTMATLIDALRPRTRRWSSVAILGLGAGLVGVGAWAMSTQSRAAATPVAAEVHTRCQDADAPTVLPEALGADVERFLADAPSAVGTRFRSGIDEALEDFHAGRGRVCGQHSAGQIDAADLELRLRCFDVKWIGLTGRVREVLTSEEPFGVIRRVRGTPDCEDPKLAEVLPLHDDAALDAYVQLSRDRSALQVKQMDGGFAVIGAEVEALEERARSLQMNDVLAEILYMKGSSLLIAGQLIPAREALIAAANAAVSSGSHVVAVQAWNSLTMTLVQDFEDTERAEEYLRYAKASIARVANLPIAGELKTENLYQEGFLRLRQQRTDEALAAVEAGSIIAKTEEPDMVANFEDLRALIYSETGEHDAAVEACLRAKALRIETVGPDHPYTGYTRALLGGIYNEVGKYELAADELVAARKIMEKAYGTPNAEVSFRYKEEAILMAGLDRHEEARHAMARAGETMSEAGKTDAWLDDYLQSQAHVANLGGDVEAALKFSREAVLVAKRLDPDGNQQLWMAEMTVANSLSELGRADEALPFANRWAAADAQGEHALSPSDAALITSVAVEILVESKRYPEAVALIKQGLGHSPPFPPPERVDLHFSLARVQLALGDRVEATRLANKTLVLLREIDLDGPLEALRQWAREAKIVLEPQAAMPAASQ